MKLSDMIAFLETPDQFDVLYRGHKVTYLNEGGALDCDSCFFVAGFEFGATHIIHVQPNRGEGFEAAYEAWIDALPTIDNEELPEAYGPPGGDSFHDMAVDEARPFPNHWEPPWEAAWDKVRERAKVLLDEAHDKARDEDGEWPEIIEGYRENSSGGVVSIGHYEHCEEADLSEVEIVRKCGHEDCAECPELGAACRAGS